MLRRRPETSQILLAYLHRGLEADRGRKQDHAQDESGNSGVRGARDELDCRLHGACGGDRSLRLSLVHPGQGGGISRLLRLPDLPAVPGVGIGPRCLLRHQSTRGIQPAVDATAARDPVGRANSSATRSARGTMVASPVGSLSPPWRAHGRDHQVHLEVRT